jgi:predicted membrane channel-forming protein YqfA (hemolysin III family)
MTVTLLIVAFLFSPALLMLSGSFGFISVSVALVSSVLCIAFAWINWKNYSQLTIPSIETPPVRAE